MQWMGRRESSNVEDRRGMGGRGLAVGGGASIIAVILALVFGVNPSQFLGTGPTETAYESTPAREEQKRFVSVVLADTEDVWRALFRKADRVYSDPRLILFHGKVESACGFASAAIGPFYCPEDATVYIDLKFYDDLKSRFGAPGDFAQAYVIAHEVGHHVQRLLLITDRVHSQRGKISQTEYNRLSVRLELQADFLAGVWAHHAQKTKNILERGDLEEALQAAQAIGDDRLQQQGKGYVVPDSFTHGTSAQRMRWFKLGFDTGDFSRLEELFRLPYDQL